MYRVQELVAAKLSSEDEEHPVCHDKGRDGPVQLASRF